MSDFQKDSPEEITGFIDHIIYRNEDNGYTVLVLDSDISVTGIFPGISEGENLRLTGEFVFHETYGEQFKATGFEIIVPSGKDDIRKYLGSGAIKGIGPALAKRIVDKFGEDTFRIMEEEPERLAEVRGISENKAIDICQAVMQKTRDRNAILFLMKYGLTNQMAMKVYRHYGMSVYAVMEKNPYRLAEDIRGIGFKAADEIARKIGIEPDSDHRVRSGILFVLYQALLSGHTYLPREILVDHSVKLLSVPIGPVEAALMQLSIDKKIAVRGDRIYLYNFYKMEFESASMLQGLSIDFNKETGSVERFLGTLESREDFVLDEMQLLAVRFAATRGVTVLTGGPGTGKTTTIRTIIDYFDFIGKEISLCAPTGRAAKRMSESTGREAMTIHRLLEVSSAIDEEDSFKTTFARGSDYPLETDVVIVDEASMVDISLFYALLKAIPLETRLILVGDSDQLPSVGPGNVLRDIIESETCPVVRLINIFRQKERSDIVGNAHKILSGEEIPLDNKSNDFFFLKRNDLNPIMQTVITLIRDKLPSYVDAKPFDIQVLTPTRKGNMSVDALNTVLQKYLNPPGEGITEQPFGDRIFRVGDKVMQTKNNYNAPWRVQDKYGHVRDEGTGIYNGDMGVIREINKYAKLITIEFDDEKLVEYPFNQLEELEHSFAVTVHKSQGSEYPAVIIPLFNVPRMLMNRNLIYTAITRAKRCVVLVGSEDIFKTMVENDTVLRRYSSLKEALLISFGLKEPGSQ